jgi:hypothetical protein
VLFQRRPAPDAPELQQAESVATLRAAANDFPWPDEDALLDALISRLAYIDPPDSDTGRRRRSS